MTFDSIVTMVCDTFKVHPRDLLGDSRFSFVMDARKALYLVLRDGRGMTSGQVGLRVKRDHSTVRRGIISAKRAMQQRPAYRDVVGRLTDRVRAAA